MNTTFNQFNFAAILLAGLACLASGSSALAVTPMLGFGGLNQVNFVGGTPAFLTEGADLVSPTEVKLYGGANTDVGSTFVSIEWIISLGQSSLAGHSIYGDYDYFYPNQPASFSQLFVDPDGSGGEPAQLIATEPGVGLITGLISSIALPVGATEISVRLETTGNPASVHVPQNSIDLFYVVPEPSSFALAAISLAGLAAFRRKRK